MKQISVKLDELGERSLYEIMALNDCTISDAVNIALLAFAKENTEAVMVPGEDSPVEKIAKLVREKMSMSLKEYCELRHLNQAYLRQLVRRCEAGATVYGFGNTESRNKWRDKERAVQYKTHTAWIATCLMDDLGIDIT